MGAAGGEISLKARALGRRLAALSTLTREQHRAAL
jgi:hypothetical protein